MRPSALRPPLFRLVPLAAALALLAAPAAADPNRCRAECVEAVRVCHRAAHVAHRICRTDCAETIRRAQRAAIETCREERLDPEACRELIRGSVEAAVRACHGDCREVFERARARCQDERAECAAACDAALDPACVESCREELAECRAGSGTCAQGCAADAREGLASCRTEAEQTGDREALRACIAEVHAGHRDCGAACGDAHPCGRELGMCLVGCAPRG
jgi:hypothetical protein